MSQRPKWDQHHDHVRKLQFLPQRLLDAVGAGPPKYAMWVNEEDEYPEGDPSSFGESPVLKGPDGPHAGCRYAGGS